MNTYDPIKHEYFIDDIRVPSVTELLPEKRFFVSEQRLEETRIEGEENHDLIKMYFDTREPGFHPMLLALDEWIQTHPEVGQVVQYETPMFSLKHRYAGTPDTIFTRAIIDFKRSFGNKKDHALQIGGYHGMAIEHKIIKATKQWLILVFDGEKFVARNVYNERAERIFQLLAKRFHINQEVQQWLQSN